MPDTTSQAQYSLPFSVATMLEHGQIGLPHISAAGLSDRAIARLVDRTDLIVELRHEARFPQGRWADISIEMADGRMHNSGDMNARGGPEEPFTTADICAKFSKFSGPVLGHTRTTAIRDAGLALTTPDMPFSILTDLLYDAP